MAGSLTPIDLVALSTKDMPRIETVIFAMWDATSTKIAFNLSTDQFGSGNETNLFILEPQAKTLQYIEDNVGWVGDLAWDPDGTNVMTYSSPGGNEDGYSISILYLIDTISEQTQIIDVLPDKATIAGIQRLLWSPDGNYIAVTLADKPGNSGLYVIEVGNNK